MRGVMRKEWLSGRLMRELSQLNIERQSYEYCEWIKTELN